MASRKRRSQTQNHVKVKQNESKKNNTQNIKRSLKNKSYTFNKRHTESSNSSSSIEEEKNTGMRREEKRRNKNPHAHDAAADSKERTLFSFRPSPDT